MSWKHYLERFRWIFSACLVVFMLGISIYEGAIKRFEWDMMDLYMRVLHEDNKADPRVKIILIDDHTLQEYSHLYGRWPWPRKAYEPILDFLRIGRAKAVYFDMLFSEQEVDQESQAIFEDSINAQDNVSIGMVFSSDSGVKGATPLPKHILEKAGIDGLKGREEIQWPLYNDHILPIPQLAEPSHRMPVFSVQSDQDGVYRRMPLLFQYDGSTFAGISIWAIHDLSDIQTYEITPEKELLIGPYRIPMDEQGNVILNWYRSGFEPFSFGSVLASWHQLMDGQFRTLSIKPNEFKDCIVMIGASAVGLHDLKSTPIHAALPGIEFHATLLSNIIQGNSVIRLNSESFYLLIALFILVTLLGMMKIQNLVKHSIPFILIFGYMSFSVAMFELQNIYFPILGPIYFIMLAYLTALIYNGIVDRLEQYRIKQKFAKYLSPGVLKEVLTNFDELKPEVGQKTNASILFSDIRSFTSISEQYQVEIVVRLLNQYFEAMIEEIHVTNGTLDKLIGDAIMAFWNAPVKTPDHPLQAVNTAFKMKERLILLNQQWKEIDFPEIQIGVGIHTGESIIGNIGSKQRLDYTAIGDSVNICSRLESLTKSYKADIIISDATYQEVKEAYACRLLDKVVVKGKKEPVSIYEPFVNDRDGKFEMWGEIFRLYASREWKNAKKLLHEFDQQWPNDHLVTMYQQRIELFEGAEPEEGWSGEAVLSSK